MTTSESKPELMNRIHSLRRDLGMKQPIQVIDQEVDHDYSYKRNHSEGMGKGGRNPKNRKMLAATIIANESDSSISQPVTNQSF